MPCLYYPALHRVLSGVPILIIWLYPNMVMLVVSILSPSQGKIAYR